MPDLNKVMLIGRLTRDVQLRFLPSQSAVADFGFAVGRKFKTANGEAKEETCFIDCACFGKSAETLNKYVSKGSLLFIEGRLHFEQWDDKQSGQKRSKLRVIVDQFQFLDPKPDGAKSDARPSSRPGGYGGQTQTPEPAGVVADDDIPF